MRDLEEILNNPKIIKVYKNIKTDKFLKLKLECRSQSQSDKAIVYFTVIYDWEHLSVSFKNKMPSWETMCEFKDMFWTCNEDAFQYHPTADNYVNNNEYTLHIWRPLKQSIPIPPSILVGLRLSHLEEDKKALKELQEYIGSPMTDKELDLITSIVQHKSDEVIQEQLQNLSTDEFLKLYMRAGII